MTSRKRFRELSLNDRPIVGGAPRKPTTISADALFPELVTVWFLDHPRIDGQEHEWLTVL